ncbi:MAG: radical SAM protein [Candidatus Gastranaerophilaceae bacterium]
MSKLILSGMSLEQLTEFTDSIEESKYRAKQLHNWIYLKSASTFEQMSDISKKTREKIAKIAQITNVKIKHKQVSVDGTIKYLLEYPDGNCVETVLMRFDNRANLTACVSSQVGCACNCKFCATAKLGFIRNLTPVEIIEQVLTIQRDTGLKVTNIVFMGQGEPLLNLDNVLKAIDIFNKDFVIGIRRLTVSTCGIIS